MDQLIGRTLSAGLCQAYIQGGQNPAPFVSSRLRPDGRDPVLVSDEEVAGQCVSIRIAILDRVTDET